MRAAKKNTQGEVQDASRLVYAGTGPIAPRDDGVEEHRGLVRLTSPCLCL